MNRFFAVSDQAAQMLRRHAEHGWPEEVCGFLVGGEQQVRRIRQAANRWDEHGDSTRRNRFAIAPDEYLAVETDARREGDGIIGFYHSHPDAPAIPSGYDLAFAQETFPGYLHLIVSVQNGRSVDTAGWILEDDGAAFVSVALVEGEFE